MYKKRDTRAELLFCQSKPITFLPFSLLSPEFPAGFTLTGALTTPSQSPSPPPYSDYLSNSYNREKVKNKHEKGTLHPLITYNPLTATHCVYMIRLTKLNLQEEEAVAHRFQPQVLFSFSFSFPSLTFRLVQIL